MKKFVKIENGFINFINEEVYLDEINGLKYYIENDDEEDGYVKMYKKDGSLYLYVNVNEKCVIGIMEVDNNYNIGIIDDCMNEMKYKIVIE